MDTKERIKSELYIVKPTTLILGDERFTIHPPASLLMFKAIETIEEDFRDSGYMAFPVPARDRWALRVRGRILAVTKPDGNSSLKKTIPEKEHIIELSATATHTRRDFRKWLRAARRDGR
jgi:hypothetical protein